MDDLYGILREIRDTQQHLEYLREGYHPPGVDPNCFRPSSATSRAGSGPPPTDRTGRPSRTKCLPSNQQAWRPHRQPCKRFEAKAEHLDLTP